MKQEEESMDGESVCGQRGEVGLKVMPNVWLTNHDLPDLPQHEKSSKGNH